MNLRDLPKVELHLHLDCSLSYDVVKRIKPSVTEEEYMKEFVAPAKCMDLVDFLTRAVKGFELMQTTEQLKWVVDDLFNQLQADNMLYAEIRFAPFLHLQKGLNAHEVVTAVNTAVAAASVKTGIEARVILCTLRHFSEQQSMDTVKLVEQFKNTYVAGFDIAGDEAGYPVDAHKKAFEYASTKEIPCTAHAGEARGADSVWESLNHFGPSRIGHGARSIEDEKLMRHLKDNGVHLEVCPSSNVQTNMFDKFKDHPVDRIYRSGVPMSINTDTRTITWCTLNLEYDNIRTNFGWSPRDFYNCNVNALNAAFISSELREDLLARLKEGYREFLD
ncbi:MAG: adenosine deaminase [Chitinophagaceae bacterium]|nr:adenosine deaminase [Chitinophagaceae bacterium]